jgi:hypothetical protein
MLQNWSKCKLQHSNAALEWGQVQLAMLECSQNAGKYKFQHWKSCRIGAHANYNTGLLKMQQVQDYSVGILHWYLAQVQNMVLE